MRVENGAAFWLMCPGMSLEEVENFVVQPPGVLHFVIKYLATLISCWMRWCTHSIPNILEQVQLELRHPDITNQGMPTGFVPVMEEILSRWARNDKGWQWPDKQYFTESLSQFEVRIPVQTHYIQLTA